jgi:Spy/CpxP family protein refolding chaperone
MSGGRPMGNPGTGPQIQGGQRNSGQRASGLQLGPPGQRWWDDKSVAKSLKLKPEQQTRMDAIFEDNRNTLVTRFQDLQQAETHMDELTKGASLDEAALFAQIDRIAEARAALAKASTHMFLQIRNEMDPDQIARLDKQR